MDVFVDWQPFFEDRPPSVERDRHFGYLRALMAENRVLDALWEIDWLEERIEIAARPDLLGELAAIVTTYLSPR
ncbi:MAG: hypothetical protein EXR58_03220 [Chloroflexi bacterium]|nr:hypothetical protein [Chloroflexota bacterium]